MVKKVIESVAFVLVKGSEFLVEKRKMDKRVDPGKIAIPSGGVLDGETPKQAVFREIKEELSITPKKISFLCVLPYPHKEVDFIINYFVITAWTGEIINNEAEKLLWVKIGNWTKLDLKPDQKAIKIYTGFLKK